MSESLVGRAVASIRQKAGSVIGVPEPEGENGPAAVGVADLIVTFGIVSAARFAHAVPADAAGVATWATVGTSAAARATARRRSMVRRLLGRRIIRAMMLRRTALVLLASTVLLAQYARAQAP